LVFPAQPPPVGVISFGYEPEAHGLKRRLSEASARLGAVINDPSGEHARQWLAGRGPSTPQRIVGKFGSLEPRVPQLEGIRG
jgi:hypothetical protein